MSEVKFQQTSKPHDLDKVNKVAEREVAAEEGYWTIGHCLLRQVIVDDEGCLGQI